MKKERIYDISLFFILLIYFAFMAWCILFKNVTPMEVFNENRYFSRTINLVPFNDIRNGIYNSWDLYGNVFIFVPLGFYLSLYRGRKPVSNLLFAVFLSVSLESAQYVFGIGATDITDVILNSVGAFVGMIIYLILKLIVGDRERIKKFALALGSGCAVFIILMALLIFKYNP